MNSFARKFGVLSAGVLLAAASIVPASAAMPVPAAAPSAGDAHIVLVQHRRHHRGRVEMRHGRPYYHGHRGYRHHRRGYREYNGYWFPPAAFIAGAIIGGAMTSGSHRVSSAHVRWCENRYRSYRASDDTFQPYNGPRQRCISPYN